MKTKDRLRKSDAQEDEGIVPTEDQLQKAMDELEAAAGLRKGDALQNNDTEGDFSTEGEKLSKEAKKGKKEKPDLSKKYSASDMDSSDDEDDEDMDDEDEDEDEDMDDKKDMGKSERPRSLRDRARGDDSLKKAIDASDFLEGFVRNTDQIFEENRDYLEKRIEKSDRRLAGFTIQQKDFNGRLVKSQVILGRGVAELLKETKKNNALIQEQNELLKSLGAQPVQNGRIGGGGDGGSVATREPERGGALPGENDPMYPKKVADWLVEKSIKGEVDPGVAAYFESNGYNFNLLREFAPQVAKQCETELRKAAA